ncbi:MAG: mucoidy inhibitor MuiA family protein [Desulfovermiculus sp.]|nr:mucoidy inhibitor MuiA family protein [Desulfovermiculus sp.]
MRKYFFLVLIIGCLGYLVPALAGIDEATLYPDGSEVIQTEPAELEKIAPGQWQAVLRLPASVDADSLRILQIQKTDVRIQGLAHRLVRSKNQQRIAEIQKKIEALQEERDQVQAVLAGVTARIDLWQNAVQGVSSSQEDIQTKDLYDLSSSLAQVLPSLTRDKTDKEKKIQDLETKIRDLEKELQESIDNPDSQLEVRVQLSGSDFAAGQEIPITVSYLLPASRWRPAYTLDAQPNKDRVDFQWKAMVVQKSGMVWEDAHLYLTTGRTHQRVSPPDLPDWIIQPRPTPRPMAGQDAIRTKSEELALRTAQAPQGAARTQYETFDLWDAGIRTIHPGQEQQVHVSQNSWPADFQRILRPAVDNQAYLKAEIEIQEAQNIPPGEAMFLVQNRMIGKRRFAFSGQRTEISFGSDPQVTGQRIMERKQEGEQGILKNKQKLTWHYRFDLTNGKDDSIQLRLEEARPVSRHEDIQIDLASPDYNLQIEDQTVYWELTLQAGQEVSIPLQVTVTAPKDMDLSTSR